MCKPAKYIISLSALFIQSKIKASSQFLKMKVISSMVEILKLRLKQAFIPVLSFQGAHWSEKSQGNLFFLQGQGKVREFCKMVREIRKSSKVREKSGNFKIMLG